VREWYSPPQVARERSIRVGKVLAWIHSGELCAVNHAERRGGIPRWRISAGALAAFDAARTNRAAIQPKQVRAKRRVDDPGVIQFF